MKTISKIVKNNAAFLADVEIEIKSSLGWVKIIDNTGFYDYIFLDGNDGVEFIEQAKHLYNTLGDVTMDECLKHMAKPYIECIWS